MMNYDYEMVYNVEIIIKHVLFTILNHHTGDEPTIWLKYHIHSFLNHHTGDELSEII